MANDQDPYGTSNSVINPSGTSLQARDVHGDIHIFSRPALKPLLWGALPLAVLLVGIFQYSRPIPVSILTPVHDAQVDRCVSVTVQGRAAPWRGLVVGVYAPFLNVVYLSRVLDGTTTGIPLAVGGRSDRAGTRYDVVVLSAPTEFLDELRQAAEPRPFTAAELAERDVTREGKITVVRKGPDPDQC
ncbi:hypothetical protein [Umezawaea sp. NPDC059074]|uniref:hypothetical protein n=1 Tax=Umezawaea sp. NPDC059074 TaxID=3346716 RepID=UPI003688C058